MSGLPPSIEPSPDNPRHGPCAAGARIECVERHDQAYHLWRASGFRRRVLVHIDAHHDLWWCAGAPDLSIGNFVCLALREDIVDRIFWVVPEATWDHAHSRNAVLRHLRRLHEKYPPGTRSIEQGQRELTTTLLGKRITVCSLSSLPLLEEPVLLDIDVDYFVIPFVCQGETDTHAPLPWQWPEALVERLRASGLQSDCITIAFSVDGGYTPLKWKYLGSECAARLRDDETVTAYAQMRFGATFAAAGDWAAADRAFQAASRLLPGSAAPWCHLAGIYLAAGRDEDARRAWQEALTRDPSYRSPYSTNALIEYADRKHTDAESSWRRALLLDPEDAFAHLGLAFLAGRRKDWSAVKLYAQQAIAIDPDLIDAHRMLGRSFAAGGEKAAAIASYERSIRLALAGHRPIAAAIATATNDRPADPDFFSAFAQLARLYAAEGDVASALQNYRMATAGGAHDAGFHADMGWLYLRRGHLASSAREWCKGLMLIPSVLASRARRVRMMAGHAMRNRFAMPTV